MTELTPGFRWLWRRLLRSRWRRPLARGAWAALAAALCAACAGSYARAPRVCLDVAAGPRLNLFEGQPHVVVLQLFPLRSATAFSAADVDDLVRGARPAGISGEPWEMTLLPGSAFAIDERLPRETASLGVIADFYGAPRRALLSAACPWFGRERLLAYASELEVVR